MITEAHSTDKPATRMGAMRLPGGARLETAWWGPGPDCAPTLVMLHEGLGSIGLWRDTPARLAAGGFGVFAWSRQGYGRSDACALPRPVRYLYDEAAALPAALHSAGIRTHVLIGHSDGASIAAIHAGEAPHPGLRGLALISPHYFVESCCLAAQADIRAAYRQGGLRARLAKHHDHVDAAFHGWNDAWLHPDFRALDLAPALARIGVPTLQVQGTDDPYGTTAQTDYAEARIAAPVRTLLAPARHAPHLEAADSVLPAILAFAADCLTERLCAAS